MLGDFTTLYSAGAESTEFQLAHSNLKVYFCGGNAAFFFFFADMRGGKTPYKRKTAHQAVFQGHWGEYPRSITTDCRLWRIKGGCYGAAVKENSRSKRIFSLGTARVGSAVRKSLIFERAAFPVGSVSIFRDAQTPLFKRDFGVL